MAVAFLVADETVSSATGGVFASTEMPVSEANAALKESKIVWLLAIGFPK